MNRRFGLAKRAPELIRWRAVVIGVALLPINAYWIAMVEMVWHGFHFSATSIPLNVVCIVFTLALFNAAWRRIRPESALSRADLIVIYAILATTTSVIAHDSLVSLMGLFTHPFWFATPENEWASVLQPHLPRWLVMDGADIAAPFYLGGANFLRMEYLREWIVPILSWTAIATLVYFLVACVNILLRRQWIEHEKLPYPITALPLDLAEPTGRFFRNRAMWLGFALAAGVELVNGFSFLWPTIPTIPIREQSADVSLWIGERPWSAMGPTFIHFRLFLIGLCFLLPVDVGFSTGFFYLVRKAQLVLGASTGLGSIPYYPFLPHQSVGAVVAIVALAAWTGRRQFAAVGRRIVGMADAADDSDEPISFRTAAVGAFACLILLFAVSFQAGMSPFVFVVFIALYLAIAIAVTRVRAELGPPVHDMIGVNPQTVITTLVGTRPLGVGNLVVFSMYSWFNGSNRSHPMPHQLEALKLSQQGNIDARRLLRVLVATIIPAVFVALVIYLIALYRYGAAIAVDAPGQVLGPAAAVYNSLARRIQFPEPADLNGSLAMLFGLAFAGFLAFMRLKAIWWPLHPVGYAIGINGGSMDHFWFVMLLTAGLKYMVFKVGGARLYRRMLPFFLGLVLGDVLVGSYWSILSVIVRKPLYVVWFW